MISYKIDVTKIDKAHLYAGKKGRYLSGLFMPNKDGRPSEWGDDGYIVQGISKEARAAGRARANNRKLAIHGGSQTHSGREEIPF